MSLLDHIHGQTGQTAVLYGAIKGAMSKGGKLREQFPIIRAVTGDPNVPAVLVNLNDGTKEGKWMVVIIQEADSLPEELGNTTRRSAV